MRDSITALPDAERQAALHDMFELDPQLVGDIFMLLGGVKLGQKWQQMERGKALRSGLRKKQIRSPRVLAYFRRGKKA